MEFEIFRGVKKPLLLLGLKDHYIYWAFGLAATGAGLAIVLSSLIGLMGLFLGLGFSAAGILFTFRRQTKVGLYRKTRNENFLYVRASRINARF
ncbi:DUF4133 domain-containing protein [Chryseobacterium sp. A301]